MAACYVFGSGFGRRKLKPIIKKFPDIVKKDLDDMSVRTDLYNGIISIDGYQKKTTYKFLEGLPEFITFYESLPVIENQQADINVAVKVTGSKFRENIYIWVSPK